MKRWSSMIASGAWCLFFFGVTVTPMVAFAGNGMCSTKLAQRIETLVGKNGFGLPSWSRRRHVKSDPNQRRNWHPFSCRA